MSRSCRRRSNSESGLGRLDLTLQPPPHLKRPGVLVFTREAAKVLLRLVNSFSNLKMALLFAGESQK